jgi:stage V sporulation protein B
VSERDARARAPDPAPVGTGRGLIFISAAKLWFMVAGYVVQFALPRALGSPAKFGVWVLVLAAVSPINNVMVTATIQGVSKFISESDGRGGAVTRAALRMQTLLGGGVALAFFSFAPSIAWFLHDPSLTPDLRLAAGVILCYSFYAVFVGAANGARAFHKQAALDITFSTLRAALVVGAGVATHSALASLGGFVAAAATILVVAVIAVGVGAAPAEPFPTRRLAQFFAGVAVYLLIVNLLMFVDGLLLKRLVAEAAARAGAANPAAVADTQEGFYGAVQAIARIPYQLILAVTFVIFPLVSRATFDQDAEKTRGYVRSTMRYSLLVAALLASSLGARPEAVMRLLYKPEYAVGAPALAVLLVGYVFFSLFTIAGTIINGAGRTRPTTAIGLVTLLLATGATYAGIAAALASGGDPLFAAALATTAVMAVALVLSGVYLRRAFGAFLPMASLARTTLAVVAALGVGRVWPSHGLLGSKLGTLIAAAVSAGAFLAVAVATGELRPRDLRRARS